MVPLKAPMLENPSMRVSWLCMLAAVVWVAWPGFEDSLRAQQMAEPPAHGKENGKDEDEPKSDNGKKPRTLFEWAIGGKEEDNGAEEPPRRLEPDRPHFPEAASTVGLGRVVLESGYTFNSLGGDFHSHSYPEMNLRIGLFAEWFELRIQQNFLSVAETESGVRTRDSGAADLSLGFKLALTEQKKYLPETAVIVQMTVPTGASAFTNDAVLFGVNYDFAWELVKDKLSLEGVISGNGTRDDVGHRFVLMATGLSAVYNVTHNLELFSEWYGLYPAGAVGPLTGPQHYAVSGLVYYFTDNFLIDARAGVGLNEHATDYLLGAGFAVRY